MATTTSFCRICEAACGIKVEVEAGRVKAIAPDPDHVISRGYTCIKGIRYADVHNSPDRLQTPLRRNGNTFEPISWERAIADIGARVKQLMGQHTRDAIGLYIGNPAAFSLPHSLALYGFIHGIGSRNIYSSGSQDCNNKLFVARHMYGASAIQPIPDIGNTDCLICLGSNPAVSHASFIHLPRPIEQLRAIEKRGGKVWLVNPRRTETARVLGDHVFIRPGTDVFFLLSFLHRIQQTGGIDRAAIERHCHGWDDIENLANTWPATRTAPVTGIDEKTVHAMAADFMRATRSGGGASLYCSTGVNQGAHGTLAFWLLNVINAVTGNLDRKGGALVSPGLVDLPRMMRRLGVGTSEQRSRLGDFPAVMDTFPAGVLADEITTPGPRQVRAMFVSAGNPLLSCPDESKLTQAFAKLDLLVCIDMFRNETGNLADYILPATSFLERADLPLSVHGFATEPFAQYTEPVVPALGQARDEWWIYRQLARACGVPFFGRRSVEMALRAGEALHWVPGVPADAAGIVQTVVGLSRHVSMAKLRRHPSGVKLDLPTTGNLHKRLLTQTGRVELAPATLVANVYTDLEQAFRRFGEHSAGNLLLISRRDRHGHNSWLHNIRAMHPRGRTSNQLLIHPHDAAARKLETGDRARIENEVGALEVPIHCTEDMMPGTVALQHGWGHDRADGLRVAREAAGVNVNRLAAGGAEQLERHTGMVKLNGIAVTIKPAQTETAALEPA